MGGRDIPLTMIALSIRWRSGAVESLSLGAGELALLGMR